MSTLYILPFIGFGIVVGYCWRSVVTEISFDHLYHQSPDKRQLIIIEDRPPRSSKTLLRNEGPISHDRLKPILKTDINNAYTHRPRSRSRSPVPSVTFNQPEITLTTC